jgi:hypothetical protein
VLPIVTPPNPAQQQTRIAYAAIFAVTLGALTAAVCNEQPLLSANDRSRWCTVWSLVERGTYKIDEIDAVPGWQTIDKVRHEGHFYSSKPPLWATIVAGVYWIVRGITGWTLIDHTDQVARIILFVVNVLPLLAGSVVMMRFAGRYAKTPFAGIFLVVAFSLATFLTTFTVTLNNHTVAALSALAAIYFASRILIDRSDCPGCFAIAGFFASFAAVNDLPAAAFAIAVFGLALYRSPPRTLTCFVPAALVPLAANFLTTYLASGGWKPFYAYYGTEKYRYVVDGVPSYWMHPAGLDANRESPLVYLLNCTIGHHGIFSLSPIFLIALLAWVVPRLSRGHLLRIWVWLAAALTVIVLGFYLTKTDNYNYGGNCAGLRWTFWLIPLWLVSMTPVLDAWTDRRAFKCTAWTLLTITTFSTWYAIDNPWQQPWLFRLMEREGWIHYDRPTADFNRPVTTFFPLLPSAKTPEEWIEFASVEPTGTETRLRLADKGRAEQGGRRVRNVLMTWNSGREDAKETLLAIDESRFDAGAAPADFLVWPKGMPTPAARQSAETFLSGMPSMRRYRRGKIRYLKTTLRRNAFETRLSASRVQHKDSATGRTAWHRVDAWLTPAVPFGVLQFEQSVFDDATGDLIARRRFTAVRASPLTVPASDAIQEPSSLNIP